MESVVLEKDKSLSSNSVFTESLWRQVHTCIIRRFEILWNDKATFLIKQISTLVQALVAGSLFYNAAPDSTGLFVKSGSLFFAIMYNGLMMPLSEVTDSFNGRPVLVKHKNFGFFHPSAQCIAEVVVDIPVTLFQLSHFSLILYFMTGLTMSAGHFFTYWITLVASTMCLTAMFRAIGAMFRTFDGASKISGFLVTALVIYTGYMIEKPQMHPWLGWIFWINPLAYGFEALLANEFHQKVINCMSSNLIPNGPGYTDRNHMACSGVVGAVTGATSVTGEQYLDALSYSHSHVWRNFGILWAWWALFVAVTIVFTIQWVDGSSGSAIVVPYEKRKHYHGRPDEESLQAGEGKEAPEPVDSGAVEDMKLVRNTSIFTWRNLCYTVKVPDGERQLLSNIYGWVEPGSLTALMGSSGAGKTTLLDVLAQRKTEGAITGSVLVDGRPLPISFQRSTGYCEQLDVHEPYSTVREALQFSALLRQPEHIPKEEKLAYVETIIQLLELHDIADTLIGRVGAGLNVEQRKRVTIGVELVAKPKILLFLDEPTSGLDGQSAFNTVCTLQDDAPALFFLFQVLTSPGPISSQARRLWTGHSGHDTSAIVNVILPVQQPYSPRPGWQNGVLWPHWSRRVLSEAVFWQPWCCLSPKRQSSRVHDRRGARKRPPRCGLARGLDTVTPPS
jgi:ABC-type multidrug transport system permease subunit/ABC-type nitrate/sulfonate/bicarbonate transport system ATPase subunit